ncbi:ABC transporter permease [Bacillus sp. RO1]|uniref:ABC transporter permease n=1 Tax=Bacillus sp. RO1 TaxID=2722703 RepID=UPI001456AB2E|nr:ABC transporter permease [Bacillus sp. RO1]NLP52263.1 ABC transporter permease [Bacillus sp. RO1]
MRFLKQLQLESRFLLKNWFFLLAPLVYGISMSLWMINRNEATTNIMGQYAAGFYKANNEFLAIGHTLSLGVLFLASVLSIRREKQTVLLDWTNSLPNSFLSIILAKFLSLFIYSGLFTLLYFLIFLWQGSSFGKDLSYLLEHGVAFSIQSQLSYAVTISLGMVLAVLINNRIVYIIVFCAWMFGTFFMEGYIIQRYQLYFLKTFHLNQFFMDISHSDDWGYRLSRKETLYSQLFVLFFSLFLLAITIMKSSTNRISSFEKRKWTFFGLVTALTIASFFPYGSLWTERIGHYNQLKAGAVDQFDLESGNLVDTVGEFYDIDSYTLTMERVGNDRFHVRAEMTIPSTESYSSLNFSLYPSFEVDTVSWNGVKADYIKKHHLITVQDIGQQEINRLEVEYSGSLNEWGHVYGKERNFAFLKKEDMYLPSYIGWYPLPGNYPIYTLFNMDTENYIHTIQYNRYLELNQELPASDFEVELIDFDSHVFSTGHSSKATTDGVQVFTSENAKGITLFSNKGLIENTEDLPISIIAHKENNQLLQQKLADMNDVEKYFQRWLGESFQQDMKLIYIPSLDFVGAEYYNTNLFDEALFFDDSIQTYVQVEDGKVINNTMTDLKSRLVTFLLFKHKSLNHYYYEVPADSVLKGLIETYLLVFYKDNYDFKWNDFEQFNGTEFYYLSTVSHINWMTSSADMTTLEKFDELIDSYKLQYNEQVVLMVAKEWEKGNKEEIKKLLKEIYQDIKTNNKDSFTYEEWMTYWNRTFESGGMR